MLMMILILGIINGHLCSTAAISLTITNILHQHRVISWSLHIYVLDSGHSLELSISRDDVRCHHFSVSQLPPALYNTITDYCSSSTPGIHYSQYWSWWLHCLMGPVHVFIAVTRVAWLHKIILDQNKTFVNMETSIVHSDLLVRPKNNFCWMDNTHNSDNTDNTEKADDGHPQNLVNYSNFQWC